MRRIIFLLVTVLSCNAMAGVMIQADMATLQPVIDRDENGFQACGVRGLVLTVSPDTTDIYDFSLMIRHDMFYGTLKAGKMQASTKAMQSGSISRETVLPAPVNFWIAEESKGKAVSPIKTVPAETRGYILEVADFTVTFEAILGMVNGERMQFSLRYKDEPAEQVIGFSGTMQEVEKVPLMRCLTEVTQRMQKELESKARN